MVVSILVQYGSTSLRDVHRHHDFFERGIARTLADAVDRALDLANAGRAPPASELATAMPRSLWQCAENRALSAFGTRSRSMAMSAPILVRHGVADGVGNVDRRRAGLDRGLHAPAQEIVLGAGGVLGRPLDVVGVVARARHRRHHHVEDLLRLHLELPLHVDRRRRDEGVDAPALGRLDRFAAAVDVLLAGAREAADHRVLGTPGDLVDGRKVAIRGDREAGLDDVDAHIVEQLGNLELLLMGHGGARALLAVAQGGVEDDDAVLLGLCWRGHG